MNPTLKQSQLKNNQKIPFTNSTSNSPSRFHFNNPITKFNKMTNNQMGQQKIQLYMNKTIPFGGKDFSISRTLQNRENEV